jgi:hypothetical protein
VDKALIGNAEYEKIMLAISREISSLTANTKERFTAHSSASALAGGSVFPEPVEPVCD